MKGNYGKRFLSLMLSVIMVLGMLPTGVLAAEDGYSIGDTFKANTKDATLPGFEKIPDGTKWDLTTECEKIEHTHSDSCYTTPNLLACSHWLESVTLGHPSECQYITKECNKTGFAMIACGLVEHITINGIRGHAGFKCTHTHTIDCYTLGCDYALTGEHTHDDNCFVWTLQCAGHKWDDGTVITETTCETDGVKIFTCTVETCVETKTETTPAPGHAWDDADCETAKTCSVCGTIEGDALGHTEKAEKKDDATHKIVCERCEDVLEDNIPHTYAEDTHACICGDVENFTITWIVDGVKYDEDAYDYNTSVDELAPKQDGYAFDGWYDAEGNKINFAEFVVTGDIELHGSFVKSAAMIGEAIYESLGDAITAAKAGDTITLMADITENVTINKDVTIDGAGNKYSGTMSIDKANVTIKKVNFFEGRVYSEKNNGKNVTIQECSFNGNDKISYAVELRNTNKVVIKDVTAQNYSYGFLQLPKSNTSLSVKNAEISDVSFGFKVDYSNGVTMENVKVNAETYAIYASNYSVRTYTMTGCTFEAGKAAIGLWDRNTGHVDTFKFVGDNTVVGNLLYIGGTVAVKIDLTTDNALSLDSVTAEDKSSSEYHKIIKEENELYTIVKLQKEAKIGDVYYITLAEALAARQTGETIEVLLDGVDLSIVPGNLEITDGRFITDKTFTIKVKGEGTIEVTGAEEVDTVIEAAGVKTYVLKAEEITIKATPVVNDGVSATYVASIGGAELTYGEGFTATATLSVANGGEIVVEFAEAKFSYDEDGEMFFYVGMETPKYETLYNSVITAPAYSEEAVGGNVKYLARPAATYQMQVPVLFEYTVPIINYTIKIGGDLVDLDLEDAWLNVGESFKTLTPEELQKQYDTEIQKIKDEIAAIDLSDISWTNAWDKVQQFTAISDELTTLINTIKNEAEYLGFHQFGESGMVDANGNVQERIQVIYQNEAMNLVDENVIVTLVDDRMVTTIEGGNLTFEYDEFTDADIMNALVLKDAEGNVIEGALVKHVDLVGTAVGERTYTVNYAGSWDYKPCTVEFTLTVVKAPSNVEVPNVNIKHGEAADMAPVVTNKHGEVIDIDTIEILVGLDIADLDIDKDGVTGLEGRAQLILTDELQTILSMVGLEEGVEMNINDLIKTLTNTGLLEQWGVSGEMVEGLKQILDGINGIVEANNLMITIGGEYPTDTGAYLHAAVTVDANYETSYGVGYILIAPKTEQVELKWNYTDDNGVFTAELIKILGHEGMGATAYKADGETLPAEMVQDVFFGIDEEGNFIAELNIEDATKLSTGAYAQIAFTVEIGNTLYYAVPVVRPVVIVPGTAKVEIQGKDDKGFIVETFDNTAKTFDTVVKVNGEVVTPAEGELTYNYVGLQTNAQPYNGTEAPVHAGAYLVTATYMANGANGDLAAIGVDVATLVIKPAETTIVVSDLTKNAGESVNIKSEMVKVETASGQNNPDTTVVTGTVKVGGDFLTNGWADVTGEVNVDFPAWVDAVLKQYVPAMYNGLKASDFTAKVIGKIPAIEAKLEAMLAENGMEADLSKYMSVVNKVLTEVQAIANKLPADVILTFNDTDVEDTLTSGVYGVAAIVTDSDHMPSADIGLLTVGLSDKLVVDILNTTVHYNGEAQMPNIKATIDGVETETDLDLMIIVDETKDIANIIADEEIQKLLDLIEEKTGLKLADGVELKVLIEAVDSFVKVLKDEAANSNLVAKIEALFDVNASSVLSKLDGALRAAAAELPENAAIKMNGDLPVEAGTYQVMGLAVANGFMPEVTQGTLTITPHVEGEVVVENEKAPTCTEDGSYDNVTYCTVEGCGIEMSRETVTVDALGHKAGKTAIENLVEATCTKEGSYDEVTYCDVCHEPINTTHVVVPVQQHKAGEVVVENEKAATCTEDGSYDNVTYCTVCRTELSRETVTVDALGHKAGKTAIENLVDATCSKEGSYDEVTYCDVCHEPINTTHVVVPVQQHKAGEVVVENEKAATCEVDGSYDNVTYCTVCGTELSRETMTVDALGHDWDEGVVTTQPTVDAAGVKTYTCKNDANHTDTEEVPKLTAVAAIGTQGYATLADAVAAAKSGDTIVLLTDITENVTVNKNVTIDGAGKTYTGVLTLKGNNAVTIKNVDFDGKGMEDTYAIQGEGARVIVIENVTIQNYEYGLLQVKKMGTSGTAVTVRDTEISDCGYGIKVDRANSVTLENVKVIGVRHYGLYDSNYGAKTYNIKNSEISSIEIWERPNMTNVSTFNFVGANTVGELDNDGYAKYVLTELDATLAAPEGSTVVLGTGIDAEKYEVVYENGIYSVAEKKVYVAQIGEQGYETLTAAIAAAKSGDTIVLLADITEDVTVNKNVTIDGDGKTYTGKMTLNKVNVTIEDVNFVKGAIYKNKKTGTGGNFTIKNCTFDGQGLNDYAVNLGGTTNVVIENVTAKDYGYGFLQLSSANTSLSVKDVQVSNVNYGFKVDYSNGVTMENVKVSDIKYYGIYDSNYGTKTYKISNSEIGSITIWERDGKTNVSTFEFVGANKADILEKDIYAKYVLNAEDATLTAPADQPIESGVEGLVVDYDNGTYKLVKAEYVAQVEGTDKKFVSIQDAVNAAEDGETVIVLADHEIACDVDPLIKVAGKAITIDLNGKEITANATTNTTHVIFETTADAGLTMTDSGDEEGEGSVVAKGDGLYYMFRNGGTMVIEGGSYTLSGLKGGAMFYSLNDGMTVTGGNFTQLTEGWMFNTVGNSDHVITVSGGTYNRYFIGGNTVTPEENTRGEVVLAEGHILADNNNGTWTVRNDVVAMIVRVEEDIEKYYYYGSAADALAEAKGETVVMLLNSTEDIRYFIIDADDTLDLNGKTVTVNSAYFMNFGNVIDGDGTTALGALKLNGSNVMWDVSNAQLPVKTPAGEYKFVKIIGFNTAVMGENKYVFQPLFTPAAHELLIEGEAVTGVSIEIHVAWGKDSGAANHGVQKFIFKDEIVEKFVNSYKASTGKYGQMFTLTLSGTDAFTNLEVSAVVASETGVSFSKEIN